MIDEDLTSHLHAWHKHLASPVYATLHFYYDDPDSMERYKACNEALDALDAVVQFERWMRDMIDIHGEYPIEKVRAMLFNCFSDHDVKVPGWE